MKQNVQPVALLLTLAFAVLLPACQDENAAQEASNKNTISALFAAMDAGETAKFGDYCSPDFQIYHPFLSEPGSLQVFQGLIQGQKTGFPDMKHEIVQVVAEGNLVAVRGVFKGANTGSMQGNPPTGNRVELPFIVIDEFDATGKLKIRRVQFDTGAFQAQLMAAKM